MPAQRYSRKIALVKRQYSGSEKGLVRGMGVVNRVHKAGLDYYPIDYRIYASNAHGQTKHDHFREMLLNAYQVKHRQA